MSQINVDPQEIQKFAQLADLWWDKNSEFRPLHEINPLRLNWIQQRSQGLAGKKILDVGCGGGILAESMARRGADVLGIDLAEQSLKVAQIHAQQHQVHNIQYQCIPVEQLAETHAGQFDVVTCMEMLEHVPDPTSVIQACQKLVKPNGHVFLSTINRNLKSYVMMIIGAEYVLRLLSKGTHDYDKFIKPSELAYGIREAGLSLKEMTGLHYNPILKRYYLGGNVDVNYMVHTQNTGVES